MADFPERRFVLVGGSGEADLEVYTDIVMANPGRVLAVYIRDVTTPDKKFFYQAMSNVGTRCKDTVQWKPRSLFALVRLG